MDDPISSAPRAGDLLRTGTHVAFDENSQIVQSYTPDMAAEIDTQFDQLQEMVSEGDLDGMKRLFDSAVECEIRDRVASALVRMLALIVDAKSPRMEADALAAAAGLYLREGLSLADLARKHGVSRAAFQKRVKQLADDFQLPYRESEHAKQVSEKYSRYGYRNKLPRLP